MIGFTAGRALFAPLSTMPLEDEFANGGTSSGTIGQLGWSSAGTISQKVGEAAEPGLYTVATGGVSATAGRINTPQLFIPTTPHYLLWRVRLNTNDANTTARFGAGASVTGNPPNNGIYFEKLDADTNWFCVTRASSVQTGSRADSGVQVSTSLITFEYRFDGTRVLFFINGAHVATQTTNIPTAVLALLAYIINSAAADKTFDAGLMRFALTGLAR